MAACTAVNDALKAANVIVGSVAGSRSGNMTARTSAGGTPVFGTTEIKEL